MSEKACHSNYNLILSKQTFLDKKNAQYQKGTNQMNIDKKLHSHVTAIII